VAILSLITLFVKLVQITPKRTGTSAQNIWAAELHFPHLQWLQGLYSFVVISCTNTFSSQRHVFVEKAQWSSW